MKGEIWKFPITEATNLPMPSGARPLHVAMQDGRPFLWALVDPTAPYEDHHIRVYGTGHAIAPDDFIGEPPYIGTLHDGFFVFHVFVAVTG